MPYAGSQSKRPISLTALEIHKRAGKVSYVCRGRFSSRFVPRDQSKAVRVELANDKRLRELT